MPVKLRHHQIEAVDAIVRGLDIPPGKQIPADGLRATVISACGTGKTMMAAAAARRIVPGGRILVVVPTLDLLTQTVAAWRAAGHTGPAVAVCSLGDDPELWAASVRCTTSPPQLALWHGKGPVTITPPTPASESSQRPSKAPTASSWNGPPGSSYSTPAIPPLDVLN